MILTSTASVIYLVYTLFLNVSTRRRNCLICNGLTLVESLPVYCSDEHPNEMRGGEHEELSFYFFTSSLTVPLESGGHIPADSVGMK